MNVTGQASFALIVRGGIVLDGTGREAFPADVGVREDRIAAVGPLEGATAGLELDARGLAVAPGFINIHSHTDETIRDLPTADSAVLQGITTEVAGNCGFGPADLTRFRADLAAQGHCINLLLLAAHGALRREVGDDLAALCDGVDRALDAGAHGVSFGLEYEPGSRATREELRAVARRAAAREALVAVHLRDEGDRLVEAVDEMLDVARQAGARLQISHLKACGKGNWGRAFDAIERIERARAAGLEVGFDRYPYTAVMTSLERLLPAEAWWLPEPERAARLRGGAFRAHLLARFRDAGGPQRVLLASCPALPELVGRSLGEAAVALQVSPVEAAERILLEAGRDGQMVVHSLDDGETAAVLGRAECMVCTDAAARPLEPVPGLHPHPRAFGSTARFLGHYVRERGVTTLPSAVRQLAGLPAETLRLADRGRIAPGCCADLVVFDPDRIADRATYEAPWAAPAGIVHVLVNGRCVVRDGKQTGERAGRML